jgi:ABC-type Co2+ transport system permease subunit
MDFEAIKIWFLSLGDQYGVNPIVFGAIYVGAIPFFTLSVGWIVNNYRKKKSVLLPMLSTGFFFISAYLYLIVVGKNVPFWVYGFIALLVITGGYSTIRKVKGKIEEKEVIDEI